jgi:hypothetical protein
VNQSKVPPRQQTAVLDELTHTMPDSISDEEDEDGSPESDPRNIVSLCILNVESQCFNYRITNPWDGWT